MSHREIADTRRRIIESAANLFSKGGYNGASTRDIALGAQINETTMFRHFARKRDLYFAVLDSKLRKLRLRGDLLAELAAARDANAALAATFELIAATLLEEHDLLRLLQFSWLELGKEFEPLLRRHVRELIEVITSYLQPWIDKGQIQCSNPRIIILTFVAIILTHQSLFAVLSEELPGGAKTGDAQADVFKIITRVIS
jgi:AcrR family transcriptional regulator